MGYTQKKRKTRKQIRQEFPGSPVIGLVLPPPAGWKKERSREGKEGERRKETQALGVSTLINVPGTGLALRLWLPG